MTLQDKLFTTLALAWWLLLSLTSDEWLPIYEQWLGHYSYPMCVFLPRAWGR